MSETIERSKAIAESHALAELIVDALLKTKRGKGYGIDVLSYEGKRLHRVAKEFMHVKVFEAITAEALTTPPEQQR